MRGNPGVIIKLPDERLCIVYDKQPLLAEKGIVILNLVDENYNLINMEDGKPKIILKDLQVYNEEGKTLIGYVD